MSYVGASSVSSTQGCFYIKTTLRHDQSPGRVLRHPAVGADKTSIQIQEIFAGLERINSTDTPWSWESIDRYTSTSTENTSIERVHNTVDQVNQSSDFLAKASIIMYYATEMCETRWPIASEKVQHINFTFI